MKKSLITYLKNSWVPTLFYLPILMLFVLGCTVARDWVIDMFMILFIINTLGVFVSSIIMLVSRKWLKTILPIVITVLLWKYMLLVFMYSPPDYYGADKEIPKGIEIYEPLTSEPEIDDFQNSSLLITACSQPGIYCYFTNYTPNQLGHFYIKVFEITSNDRLSYKRIKERSKVKVKTLDSQVRSGEFTIYEGSWGYKYGSRIELWFKPNTTDTDEFKVSERNYIVEGWMR